jgi:hypothetical protein
LCKKGFLSVLPLFLLPRSPRTAGEEEMRRGADADLCFDKANALSKVLKRIKPWTGESRGMNVCDVEFFVLSSAAHPRIG